MNEPSSPELNQAAGAAPVASRILIVDDDPGLLRLLSLRLGSAGYATALADSAEAALAMLAAERPALMITDLQMGGMNGMELLAEVRQDYPGLPVIILTAHGTIPDAVDATRQGAFGFVTKPFEPQKLLDEVGRALAVDGCASSTPVARGNEAWRRRLLTRSAMMEGLMEQVRLVAQSNVGVLIQGESGTGKELIAQTIHELSPRADKPFLAINCGAIPGDLLESELFGHRRGAFTGAIRDHDGMFKSADGGTLLLDEVGDMPSALQIKLLRVLQEGEIKPVGAPRSELVNTRIVAATHQDLEQGIAEGTFRQDLYYRLNVVALTVPPLRERREDIALLADHFLAGIAQRTEQRAKVYAPEALELMVNAQWPGNVRQLYNVVEQTAALATAAVIPLSLVEQALGASSSDAMPSFARAREGFEREYLSKLLKITNGNVANAARMAQRNRTEFYRLLQRHKLAPAMFKRSA